MIDWIGSLSTADDARLFSGISKVFDVVVQGTPSQDEPHAEERIPRGLIVNLQGSRDEHAALLETVGCQYPGTPVFIKTDRGIGPDDPCLQHPAVVGHIKDGEPVEKVIATLRRTLDGEQESHCPSRPHQAEQPAWRRMLVGESPAIEAIARKIALISKRKSTVLITGETGTGKEVVARAIHAASNRRDRSMVTVNCGALPESLLEAELFGHAKGAFTGAVGQRVGRFEQANHGTIFLDEIGDLPLAAQTTLLRVLQEREFYRVGGVETVRVDTRVIAATNVDLAAAVERKAFRPDLLYRLHVFPIFVPPLRERLSDVEPLAEHFVEKICTEEGLPLKSLSSSAIRRLSEYHWPGNVRQLCHVIEMALVISGDRITLTADDFSLPEACAAPALDGSVEMNLPDEGLDFEELVNEMQRGILDLALRRAGGNKSRAASMLRMKRSTLVSKVKALAG